MTAHRGFKDWINTQKVKMARSQYQLDTTIVKLIGVSGSVGKSSVAHLINHILSSSGLPTGLLSTDGKWLDNECLDPEFVVNIVQPKMLHAELKDLELQGARFIIVELPPEQIKAHTYDGLEFDSVVITNIAGGEFISGFSSQAEYAETVFSPVESVENEGLVVLNYDDDSAEWIAKRSEYVPQNLYASWCTKLDVQELKSSFAGMGFSYEGAYFQTKLFSSSNLENVLQAIKLCMKYVGTDQVDAALKTFEVMPGRLEWMRANKKNIVIDYAYMPLVVHKILADIKELKQPGSKIFAVLGAAGERDKTRREIGKVATDYVNMILLSAQDPRSEKVMQINNQIMEHMEGTRLVLIDRFGTHDDYDKSDKANLRQKTQRVVDNSDIACLSFDADSPSSRADAIDFALKFAKPDDVVVIFGKGNDQVMDFGNLVYEWNDKKVVEEVAAGMIEEWK